MARTPNSFTPPNSFESIEIRTSENGFIVHTGGSPHRGEVGKTFTFETFNSLTKWMGKNLVNGVQ